MNKYYVIKSTIESTKEVFYLKHTWGYVLTKNLAEAKLFSNYEIARNVMEYAKDEQDSFIDEIVEVKADEFGNVVEIEGENKVESNVAEMNFVKVEISGVEINVTTNQQVTCVETATNSVKVVFEQAKSRPVSVNIGWESLTNAISKFQKESLNENKFAIQQ